VDSATGLNRIIFTKPQVAGIDSFVFYRRPVVGVNYVRAGAIGYAQLSTWLDSASEPQTRSEQYYMTAKNTCGQSAPSDTHRTLLLTINQGWLSADWNLIWNGYEGATHTGYNIYRGGTPNNLSLLTSISANTYNAFIDHNGPNGMVYYKVALADGPICTPGLRTSGGGEGLICSNIASRLDPSAVYTDLALYPNPSDGAGTALVQTNGRDENFSLRITDILGRIVEHREAVANTPLNFGSSFAPGIYLVEAISKEGVRIARRWVKK
jgi:hypothetical protein